MISLTKQQQDLLKSVGRKANHPEIGKLNPQLDAVIEKIKKDNPQAFLRDVDLQERTFLHEPASNTRLKAFVKPYIKEFHGI